MSVCLSHVRRTVAATVLAGLTVGALAPAATATSTKGNAADRNTSVNHEISATMLIDGDLTKLVDLKGVTQLVDSLGRAVGSPQRVALRSEIDNPELGDYDCVYRGQGNKHFSALPIQSVYKDYGYGEVNALFHTYRQKEARKVGAASRKTTQFEVCGVGGGDMGDKRMRRMGIAIAYPDAAATYKIGSAWRSGETPENYTIDLAFEVPVRGVTIGGGISQTPTNKLLGSFVPPFTLTTSPFTRNAVHAWWQDDCVGGTPCAPWKGSKDFHGTVAQGLWEFTPAQAASFPGFKLSAFLSTN